MRQSYALAWVNLWKTYHPHDSITYLASEGAIIEGDVIVVRLGWGILGKRKIAHHRNGPDRIISFSNLEPIDTSIPTITHIFDSSALLYPRATPSMIHRVL